jgi:hypothetical protein
LLAHFAKATFADMSALTASFKPTGASLDKYRVDASAPLIGPDGRASFEFD